MSAEIIHGRERGFTAVENFIADGLLEEYGFDVYGAYSALKRFVDRRPGAARGQIMDWSVKGFCKKFHIGTDRFYRLINTLWQLGLVDVEKVILKRGWKNRYIVHDYPPYEGELRVIREGYFHKRQEQKGSTSNGPKTGIPETGILGIPESGILEAGIPVAGTTNIQLVEKDNYLNTTLSSSNEEERDALRLPSSREYSENQIPITNQEGNLADRNNAPISHNQSNITVESSIRATAESSQEISTTGNNKVTAVNNTSQKLLEKGSECPTGQLQQTKQVGSLPLPSDPPTNRDLIAELVRKFHEIPGVTPEKGHYPMVGKAYNEFGYDVVQAAIDDLYFEFKWYVDKGMPIKTGRELWRHFMAKCKWNYKPPAPPEEKVKQKEEESPFDPRHWKKLPNGKWVPKKLEEILLPGSVVVGNVIYEPRQPLHQQNRNGNGRGEKKEKGMSAIAEQYR